MRTEQWMFDPGRSDVEFSIWPGRETMEEMERAEFQPSEIPGVPQLTVRIKDHRNGIVLGGTVGMRFLEELYTAMAKRTVELKALRERRPAPPGGGA